MYFAFLSSDRLVFVPLVVRADAGVFGTLALAANLGVVIDAEVLRLGAGGGSNLQDDSIAFALRKCAGRNKSVSSFLEIQRGFAGRRFSDDFDYLLAGGCRLHL